MTGQGPKDRERCTFSRIAAGILLILLPAGLLLQAAQAPTGITLDLQINPTVELARMLELAGIKGIKSKGTLKGTVRIKGSPDNLTFTGKMSGSNVSLDHYTGMKVDLTFEAEWVAKEKRLAVHRFNLISSAGSAGGNAVIAMGSPFGTSSINANLRNFNLLPFSRRIAEPVGVASNASGKLTLSWRGSFNPETISGNASLSLNASRSAPDRNILPVSGSAEIRIGAGRVSLRLSDAGVLGSRMVGTIDLPTLRTIEGDVYAAVPEMAVFTSQLARFLGRSEILPFEIAGPATFRAHATGNLREPDLVASLESSSLGVGDIGRAAVKAEGKLSRSRVTFNADFAPAPDTKMSARGTVELKGDSPALDIALNAEGMALPSLLALLSDRRLPAEGIVRMDMRFGGTIRNLTGIGSITAEQLRILQEPMGTLVSEFRISGSRILTTRLRLDKNPTDPSAGFAEGQASYALDTGRFTFQAVGHKLKLERILLPGNNPFRGTADFTANGSGNKDDPVVNLRLSLSDAWIRNAEIGAVETSAVFSTKTLTADARLLRFGSTASLRVGLRAPYPAEFKADAPGFDLSLLGVTGPGGRPVTGTLDLNIAGSGDLQDPLKSELSLLARNVSLKLGEIDIGTRGPVGARYREGLVEISPEAVIASGNSTLVLSGSIPVRREAGTGQLRARGNLDLERLTQIALLPEGMKAAGNATFDMTVTGSADSRNITGNFSLANGLIEHPGLPSPLTALTVNATLQNDAIALQQAEASIDSGRISLTGDLPFSMLLEGIPFLRQEKQRPATFDLRLTNFALESTGRLPQNMNGRISLHATGTAASLNVDSIEAEIRVDELLVNLDKITVQQRDQSSIAIRNGSMTVRNLRLAGPQTELRVSGTAGLKKNSPVDLRLDGTTDAGLLAFLIEDAVLAGPVIISMAITGTTDAPQPSGSIELRDGQASLRAPAAIALDALTARVEFVSSQVRLTRFEGTMNGGSINAGGSGDIISGRMRNLNLTANMRDVFLEMPEGLESSFNASLTVRSSNDLIMVEGRVRILESSYRDEIGADLTELFEQAPEHDPEHERNPLLSRVRFNVTVVNASPIMVRNNLAELEADADLRLVGSYYAPSIVGTVTLEEGGQIFLNERTYYIRRGIITFNNQTRIEPDLNIQAETEVGDWDITMQITGTPDRLNTQLTSEPQLSQPEIISVLLTGSRDTDLTGREMQLAQAQALSLLAGQAGQELAGSAREALGITTFRVEPSFIASETNNPGARITLGQDFTRDFTVGYSMSLVDPEDQIWIAEYNLVRNLTARVIGDSDDNDYRFGFTHELQIGGPAASRRRRSVRRPEIGQIKFEAGSLFPEQTLRDKFNLETGDTYDFPKVQKGLDRIKELYSKQNRLEARVRLERERVNRTVDLNLRIDPGPVVHLAFEGPGVSGDVRKRVRQIWEKGIFDLARVTESVEVIKRSLVEDGYLDAEVTHEIDTTPDQKVVRFYVTPGVRYSDADLVFPGAAAIEPDELDRVVRTAQLYYEIFLDPEEVTGYIESYYRDQGYLDATVSPPVKRLDPNTRTGKIEIPVKEGPQFTIGDLKFSGNRAYSYDDLWILIPISSGSIYSPDLVQESSDIIERLYRSHGFNEVVITYQTEEDSKSTLAHVIFQIDENRQSVIEEITVQGNRLIGESLVRRMLTFDNGDVLDFEDLGVSRRNLYDTGMYSFVDFEMEDLPVRNLDAVTKPVRIDVHLRELSTYRIDYGGYYDTERGPGGIADVVRRSPFGHGAALGLRARYDSDLRLARLYYAQPFIRNVRLKTDGSVILARESRPGFSARRIGMSIFQQKELPEKFVLDYGYRYDHVRWTGIPDDPTLFVANVPVARLSGTIWRDTRDSILDATKGEFTSNTFEYGPEWVGSEIGFYRYFGQYFRYFGLDRLFRKPARDEKGMETPSRFVYATAIRLGITKSLEGGEIISPERFFAGGGTTMRGFRQDLLGPVQEQIIDGEPELVPLGGEALFLLNNEIRFPIYKIFGGVGFLDIGNVYQTVSDFSLSDLRESAGVGLRIKVRYLLLRFDYGFKLDRRPGERASAFFFSIGQAF